MVTFIFAFVAGIIYKKSKSLWSVLLLHLVWNSNLGIIGLNPPEGSEIIAPLTLVIGTMGLVVALKLIKELKEPKISALKEEVND